MLRYTAIVCLLASASAGYVPEVASVESRFFGYQSGVNRDFTNYGRTFANPVTQSVPWKDMQALLADMNADGLADLVGYDPKTGRVTWAFGDGDGTFDMSRPGRANLGAEGTLLAADFDGDGLTELALVKERDVYIAAGTPKGPGPTSLYTAKGFGGQLAAGDFDGDGLGDICSYKPGAEKCLSIAYGQSGGGFGTMKTSPWNPGKISGAILAADFNGDNYCDIALYDDNSFTFWFGRGNGVFGPTSAEEQATDYRATHLKATFDWPTQSESLPLAGQVSDDGTPDIALYQPDIRKLSVRFATGEPAYDYSVHLTKMGSEYRMWHGGRWRTLDESGNSMPGWDGDHTMYAWSLDGKRWFRKIDGPVFLKGCEEGKPDAWYENNYLEPEVLKVDGTYYMFWQVEIDPGSRTDTGETAVKQCDRIGLSTSKDGITWTRKADRGVVINIADPTVTNLDHHEVIYVPDDPDRKPWWLYTFHFINGAPAGHVRMRASDPTTFDWSKREPVSGMSQIGNQIGYADEAPGGRVFVRITFTGDGDRTVPILQLSRDGLIWEGARTADGPLKLAGTGNEKDNKNVYFLGMSTIDGTGKLEHLGGGKFHALYGATTSGGPGQPHIWLSEIGIGELTISFR